MTTKARKIMDDSVKYLQNNTQKLHHESRRNEKLIDQNHIRKRGAGKLH